MSKSIVLILGAGGNIGAAITEKFSKAGYHIALAARSQEEGKTKEGHFNIKVDLTDTTSIPSVFEKVKNELGIPNLVIYNAATLTPPPDPTSMFSIVVDDLHNDVKLMTVSIHLYGEYAKHKTNMANPFDLTLGVGKAGAAYWIGTASALYADKGYKFYYADQNTPDGGPMGNDPDGPAHAEFYYQLATEDVKVPWDATFVKNKGYVDFGSRKA